MQSFVVGGYVPGTNTQFTFQDWLNITGILVIIILLLIVAFKHFFKKDIDRDQQSYQAKEASQLHIRTH